MVQNIVGWTSIDMVNIYDDNDKNDKIAKYFDENGIKKIESKKLNEL